MLNCNFFSSVIFIDRFSIDGKIINSAAILFLFPIHLLLLLFLLLLLLLSLLPFFFAFNTSLAPSNSLSSHRNVHSIYFSWTKTNKIKADSRKILFFSWMINKQNYQKKNSFLCDTMEKYCSRQCIRRTLHAVLIGVSPIIICLLLIAIARFILHCLEMSYYRRHKPTDRHRSSSAFYQGGRPTLSYTPVSLTELQRIIQGEYQSQQQSESSSSFFTNDNNSPKTSNFMKSKLLRHESSPASPANTLANLVIRRNEINSAPLTALFAPVSTFDIINEQNTRQPNALITRHESTETTTLAAVNNNNNNNSTIFYNTNDSWESESTETDPLVILPKKMTTTTVVVEEFLDFHSVHSVPYSLNLVNSHLENHF